MADQTSPAGEPGAVEPETFWRDARFVAGNQDDDTLLYSATFVEHMSNQGLRLFLELSSERSARARAEGERDALQAKIDRDWQATVNGQGTNTGPEQTR